MRAGGGSTRPRFRPRVALQVVGSVAGDARRIYGSSAIDHGPFSTDWDVVRIEARFLRRHLEARRQYDKTLALLEANPFHPSLRVRPLKGRLAGLHSVSINLSYRITLELLIEDERITLVNVGDHDAVY